MVNRRMYRPGFQDVKEQNSPRINSNNSNNGPAPSKKPAPPEVTHAENFYWVKQMQTHTPMAVVLDSGEILKPEPAHFQTRHQVCAQGRRRGFAGRSRMKLF